MQDSVALVMPQLSYPSNESMYLEAWRGLAPVSSFICISVPSLLQVRY